MNVPSIKATLSVCCLFAAAAQAQSGTLNAVHGLPSAVVDVCASGDITGNVFIKIKEDFEFTQTITEVLPEGFYDINIVPAGDDCFAAIPGLSATDVFLPADTNLTVVANLDYPGGEYELNLFVNDLSTLRPGQSDVSVQHTANAPVIDVWVGRNPKDLARTFEMVGNGMQRVGTIRPGRRTVALSLPGEDDALLDPVDLFLRPDTLLAVYAVGTFPETFTLVVLPISG